MPDELDWAELVVDEDCEAEVEAGAAEELVVEEDPPPQPAIASIAATAAAGISRRSVSCMIGVPSHELVLCSHRSPRAYKSRRRG
jgi:hypothetical protein